MKNGKRARPFDRENDCVGEKGITLVKTRLEEKPPCRYKKKELCVLKEEKKRAFLRSSRKCWDQGKWGKKTAPTQAREKVRCPNVVPKRIRVTGANKGFLIVVQTAYNPSDGTTKQGKKGSGGFFLFQLRKKLADLKKNSVKKLPRMRRVQRSLKREKGKRDGSGGVKKRYHRLLKGGSSLKPGKCTF